MYKKTLSTPKSDKFLFAVNFNKNQILTNVEINWPWKKLLDDTLRKGQANMWWMLYWHLGLNSI